MGWLLLPNFQAIRPMTDSNRVSVLRKNSEVVLFRNKVHHQFGHLQYKASHILHIQE